VTGTASIQFFTINRQKVHEMNKPVIGNATTMAPSNGPLRFATLAYKVIVGKNRATGIVIKPDWSTE
jgi:hypothetical protein